MERELQRGTVIKIVERTANGNLLGCWLTARQSLAQYLRNGIQYENILVFCTLFVFAFVSMFCILCTKSCPMANSAYTYACVSVCATTHQQTCLLIINH